MTINRHHRQTCIRPTNRLRYIPVVRHSNYDIDSEPWNRDWLRRTWTPEMPQSVEELRKFLERSGTTVEEFKESMIYLNNVDKIPWFKDL